MKIREIADLFGKPSPSLDQVMRKHGWDHDSLQRELDRGTQVESEHTDDPAVAREIALDHLWERPDYYQRLKRVEG